MKKEEFKQLSRIEAQLRKDMEAFIKASIKENQGRISLTVAEGAEGAELESENYPVTSTLYGRHDNPQIRLTEVYLDKHDKTYADGIDDDTGEKKRVLHLSRAVFGCLIFYRSCAKFSVI